MPRHSLGHIAAALGKAGVFLGLLTYSALQLFTQTLPLSGLYSYLPSGEDSLAALLLRLVQNTVTLCACVSASVCVRVVLAACVGVTRFLVDVLATVWFFFATAKESLLGGVLRRFRRFWNLEFLSSYLENCVFPRRTPAPRGDDTTDSDDDTSGSEDETLFGTDASVLSDRRPFRGRTFLMLFFGVPMVMMWAVLLILPNIRTGLRRRLRTRREESSRAVATSHSTRELRLSAQNTRERVEQCRGRKSSGKRERCAVCLDKKSRVRLMPCGHDRLCVRCARRIMDPGYQYSGTCPLCRTSVVEVVTP